MDSSNQNMRAPMEASDEDSGFITAMNLASGSVVPMALRFAVELNLLQFISNAAEAGASASELAAQIPSRNPEAADMIDRLLRLLATNSILTCTLPHGGGERRYSVAPVCKYFTGNEKGASLAHLTLLVQDKVLVDTWYHSKDAVVEGGTSFEKARGMNLFEYLGTDSRFNDIYNQAIYEQSTIAMKRIMAKYEGFEGVKTLVDVGGGKGASLEMIISKYPSIKAINFDLPHVIQDALSIPGVEHIGGDMFVSVPRAEAIFIKTICHDWSDSDVVKLLKNCYEALPENGKLIVGEVILPENPNNGLNESWAVQSDVLMLMLMFNPGGKERTEIEFHALATKAGFKRFVKACYTDILWIMEFYK